MLDKTQIQARELIIEQIDKIIEKYEKKAEKEKAKKKNAYVVYQGEKYYSNSDLQDAYACDAFSSATYDKLLEKLDKARGNVEEYELTPTECLLIEINSIKNNLKMDIKIDEQEKKHHEWQQKRAEELSNEGYSFREIETIIGNEELMRYE